MCGIAGLIGANDTRRERLLRMTDALQHRGPDEAGYYHDDIVSLGQRRLSIIDLETGQQPIANETGDLILICNGEIYNSPELRQQLLAKGHRFTTKTDVEVILHLYEEHGTECVKLLRGMFAFVIWNMNTRQLYLARDHMGQKPLYFFSTMDSFAFASEVKGVLASGIVEPKIDVEGIWHYVSMRFMPDQFSFFKNIHKLQAGTSLIWEDGRVTTQRYWDIDFTAKQSLTLEQAEQGLHDVLYDAVQSHLLSDVRVGAFLSGGIDSSTVAAMMAKASADPVPVFSIGVEEQAYNELPYARTVAKRYGMEAHEQIVKSDMIHLIPTMIQSLDEPSDPFGVGVYLVSELARKTVKVVLSGDGGDENFAGYDRYAGQRLAEYYSFLPQWFRESVMRKLIAKIPESFQYKTIAQKAKWLNEMSMFDSGERYSHSMSFLRFTQASKQMLFAPDICQQLKDHDSTELILRYFQADNANDLVDKMLYTDLMTRMPDHLLVIADRMTMAHSLEGRAPLVDHKLVEYAATLPAEFKLKGTKLKYVLKQVAGRYLPDSLIHRPKQGFGFPIAMWMRTELAPLLKNLLLQSRFVELGIFERRYLSQLVDEHLSGKADHNFRLWIWLNLELWYRLYFEGQSTDTLRDLTDELVSA